MTTRNGNSLCIQSFLLNLSITILLDLSPHSVAHVATRNPNHLSTKEESKRKIVAKSKEAMMRGDKNSKRTEGAEKSRMKMLTEGAEKSRIKMLTENGETNRSMREGALSEIMTQYPWRNQLGESLRKHCRERANIHRGM